MTAIDWTGLCAPRRELGRTGFIVTALGIGDLADRSLPLDDLVATIRRALDAGLNLIDTAPGYEEGYSETVVGRALAGRREGVFVIDKIDHHDQPVAPQVDESLRRLGMEHTDLFVFHGLSSLEGWARQTAPGGGFDQLADCVRAGKTRFRGISSHDPEVLKAAIPSGVCDVVLFPIGPYVDERYLTEVLPLAKTHRVGTVCFKTFGAGKLLGDTPGYNQPLKHRPRGKISSGGETGGAGGAAAPVLPHLQVAECLHYTLTCDPDVALLGLSFPNEQDAAFAAYREFQPLDASAMAVLRERGRESVQEKGPCWWNPGGQ